MITDFFDIILLAFIVVGSGEWIKNLSNSLISKKWKGAGYSIMALFLSLLVSLLFSKEDNIKEIILDGILILAVVETSYQALFKLPLAAIDSFIGKIKREDC